MLFGIAVIAGLVLASIYWVGDTDRRIAREIPVDRRQELYLHLRRGMGSFCRPPAIAPDGWCRAQAELLVALPECDDACERLAGPHLDRATR